MQRLIENIKKNKKYFLLIVGIFLFNILDGVLTIDAIKKGAEELNPIMRFLLEIDYSLFLFIKITLISFCLFIFWKYREKTLAQVGIIFSFCIYFFLTIYHLFMIYYYFA